MQPGIFNLKRGADSAGNAYDARIYQGDTYDAIGSITVSDLSSRGRPTTLAGATVTAQVRNASQELLGAFSIQILDASERTLKPTMTAVTTASLPVTGVGAYHYWDLQVVWGGYTDTILRGQVQVTRQETA